MDPMDVYFEDNTGVNLSPRDWATLRAPDSMYPTRYEPRPQLTRKTVQWRADHPRPICSGYRDIGPDRRDYFAKPYPYQVARGDNVNADWINRETFAGARGGCDGGYHLLLLIILFIVVAAVAFVMGATSVYMFSGRGAAPVPPYAT